VKKETIQPAKHLTGGLDLPGDKSVSHRYAMLAAMAEGTSELRHFSAAADCHSTLACMSALGAEAKTDKDTVRVTGRGLQGLKSSWRALDAGNSGTTMRLLAGILAGQQFSSKLTGDGSLQKRPMKRVIGPLREMGADIRARDDNFAPLEIRGAQLKTIDYKMPMASAQVKSAVLLAGLFADGVTSVTEPARTRITPSWPSKNLAQPSRKMGERFEFTDSAAQTAAGSCWPNRSMCPVICLPRYFLSPRHPCSPIRTC
jgi:3-phosphoshikimate 1-carboxyvinyltransferase